MSDAHDDTTSHLPSTDIIYTPVVMPPCPSFAHIDSITLREGEEFIVQHDCEVIATSFNEDGSITFMFARRGGE